ncbi:tRNA threonylcarbamoyladenosine biosynthesis protein TsaE [Acetitomaculum ruminis DSM 5522]|uniref:tRNA threonylcarbamoyladenosine biosynthesis protein TsaE n=1 Tax=Acetitomaculum ruminis DSM 5522 TaxID=1120918 RepID=A0A1I0Z7V2_9FIRM|nr:tRNA (adenosine(37)-N6)-threonylcarbamoyltransferase complex ATPase subunit type 1 TsaE [Acetitomaculum ruminis]SFB21492.1 tRNA threonylcarbamoyladenosine biosynthesis protein TsaE [Acetitomaculum ruminis DSM 5522]
MSKINIIETNSYEETFELGRKMGQEAKPGCVICLNGDLGCGKTVFTQGFAKGLGIEGGVLSPTFNIVLCHDEGRLPLYHFDVYRIGDIEEMYDLGYEEYIYSDGVCLIEWADMIKEILPEERIDIHMERDLEKGLDYRKIVIEKPDKDLL